MDGTAPPSFASIISLDIEEAIHTQALSAAPPTTLATRRYRPPRQDYRNLPRENPIANQPFNTKRPKKHFYRTPPHDVYSMRYCHHCGTGMANFNRVFCSNHDCYAAMETPHIPSPIGCIFCNETRTRLNAIPPGESPDPEDHYITQSDI